jgi:hypothetical protein
METTINEKQLAVLRWIADGCPAGVYSGVAHKVSAAALRSRGLVRTSGRGATWTAELTGAGQQLLDRPQSRAGSRRGGARTTPDGASATSQGGTSLAKTEQLVADVIAAGGKLTLPDETMRGGVNWRQRAYAAQRHGKVPAGKHLTVSSGGDRFVIELKDGATGNELDVDPVHVPARVTRYHPVAQRFRDRTGIHEVSRKALPRTVKIVHAIATELERRGHTVECATAPRDSYGQTDYKPKHEGQLTARIDGHEVKLRIWEKGVGVRGPWERAKAYYEANRLNFDLGYLPSRPQPFDKGATGELNLAVLGYTDRQASWGDRQRWNLEDRLGQALRELETQAAEAEERRLQREREQAERQRQWEAAMEAATRRFIADQRQKVLEQGVQAWEAADAIRSYCDAVEARHGAEAVASDPTAGAWLQLARSRADEAQSLPRMPPEPAITPEDLKPYLGGWSPYGPDRSR